MLLIIKIIIAIFVFGIIIVVHEFGHFIVAKACGIRVNAFAIGMGPPIFKFKKGETEYSLRWLPIGGYCAMGEDASVGSKDPNADRNSDPYYYDKNDKNHFLNKKPWQRILVIAAGGIVNLILGFVCIIWVTAQFYPDIPTTVVDGFKITSSSMTTGLLEGDKILKIDSRVIYTTEDMSYKLYIDYSRGENVHDVTVRRNGEKVQLKNVNFYYDYYYRYVPLEKINEIDKFYLYDSGNYEPINPDDFSVERNYYVWNEELDRYIIVAFFDSTKHNMSEEIQHFESPMDIYVKGEDKNFLSTLEYSSERTVSVCQLIMTSIGDIFQGKFNIDDMSGPVGVVNVIQSSIDTTESFSDNLETMLELLILLTINVGLFNLLPIPALDGGRLVFLFVEWITKKKLKPEIEGKIHIIGFMLLIFLILIFTFNDIKNLIM
jgi:regulator of sigma E protease